MEEIWKPVVGYEENYEISNFGRLKNIYKIKRILKTSNCRGYKRAKLYKNKIGKLIMVHRLVAEAFIQNTYNKPCVNHIDSNRSNNHVSNLEWCTYSENIIHCVKSGRQNHPKVCGEKHSQAKLTEKQVKEILSTKIESVNDKINIMKKYSISKSHLNLLLRRGTWKNINLPDARKVKRLKKI